MMVARRRLLYLLTSATVTFACCPGPALENLVTLSPRVFVFVMAMIAGMVTLDLWQRRAPQAMSIGNIALESSDG